MGPNQPLQENKPIKSPHNPFSVIFPKVVSLSPKSKDGTVSWTAEEFIVRAKGWTWYLSLYLISAVVSFIIYLLTKDKITAVALMVAALMLSILAAKRPRIVDYRVDEKGVTIQGKLLPYAEFRSFSVQEIGPNRNLVFFPLKRFALMRSAVIDPADEADIANVIGRHLPLEHSKLDIYERFLWWIKF